ncbi:Imm8 family immunity protein [Marinifilum fragile]|uniref:Imm8 family immunity protein n=1 Tax=Marinifilum fragile TaxID=570161 RepID=UPI002AA5EBA1|nr:Imm8 family immunity protein [Marinifilum fragile]
MKVELIHYWNSEDEVDRPFFPKEKDNFCINFQFLVGEKGKEGTEYFQVLICTPKWILKNEKDKKIISSRHRLIVFEYDQKSIVNYIKHYLSNINEDTWDAVVKKIERIAKSEYEDYIP